MYLWFIAPVHVELPLKALQGETQTPSAPLGRGLHNLFSALTKLPQTFSFTKAHLGLEGHR